MKKIILVGLGQMGQTYIKTLITLGHSLKDIFAVDIDPSRTEAAEQKFIGLTVSTDLSHLRRFTLGASAENMAAIVATTTPSHHRVLMELMKLGVRHILCEKPLAISMDAMKLIHAEAAKTRASIYTGFLMNFSPAVLTLMEMMEREKLILTEGSSIWGKNRFGDKRPTLGDLEDETVYGACILHSLARVNQNFCEIGVFGKLTFPTFEDEEVQEKAAELFESFPLFVNASTMAIEHILTDKDEVIISLHSSYLYNAQVRRITAVLSRMDSPSSPVYSIEMNFDIRRDGTLVDTLAVTTLDGNNVRVHEFACDKIATQTAAFLAAKAGDIDPRLCDYNEARLAVKFTEALKRSHGSRRIELVFDEADVIRLKEVNRR